MSYYMPAYDTEAVYEWWETGEKRTISYAGESLKTCVKGIRAVAEMHLRLNLPATFSIVARLLEGAGKEIKSILDQPLFDLQCHTYNHMWFSDNFEDQNVLQHELVDSKRLIEDTFGRAVIGLTTPGGRTDGLVGCKNLLEQLSRAGYRYVRCVGRGPGGSVPTPLVQPFWYTQDGYPDILELALHAWHDNILTGQPGERVSWPPILPWGYPSQMPRTARQVYKAYAPGIDYAVEHKLLTYTPCFHPWSIYRISRKAKHNEMLLQHAQKKMTIAPCTAVYEEIRKNRSLASERPTIPAA